MLSDTARRLVYCRLPRAIILAAILLEIFGWG